MNFIMKVSSSFFFLSLKNWFLNKIFKSPIHTMVILFYCKMLFDSHIQIWVGSHFVFNSELMNTFAIFLTKSDLHHHHHHHVVPLARISLTLSRHFSLSFIPSGRSSGLHPVSSHSCWMYVRAVRPAFARPYVGVHRSTSLMSSSLLLHTVLHVWFV